MTARMSEQQIDPSGWAVRFTGQVLGASVFLLPSAIGQAGWFMFLMVLCLEAYVTCNSLILLSEMALVLPEEECNSRNTNYFAIVERHLFGYGRFARWFFIFDVCMCTAFYFKTVAELFYLPCLADSAAPRNRSAYFIITFFVVAVFLSVFEYVSECLARRGNEEVQSHTAVTVIDSHVGEMNVNVEAPQASEANQGINMPAVVKRLHGFSKKKYVLLLLVAFLFCAQSEVSWVLWQDEFLDVGNLSYTECSGFRNPVVWKGLDLQILHVIPIILFSLMHYAIFLPICLNESRLKSKEYAALARKATVFLVIILALIPFVASFTFGDSSPILFPTAYGCNLYGAIFAFLAIAFTMMAMLVRVMGCCRLIQVLFDRESDSDYWMVVVLLFIISFFIGSFSSSVLSLVIVAGSVNTNVLLIIVPRLAYIKFKMKQDSVTFCRLPYNFDLIQTITTMGVHVLLLLITVLASPYVNPYIGQSCRELFNHIWGSS